MPKKDIKSMNIYEKINNMKENIKEFKFTLDKMLPSNLGSGEYASIGQYYTVIRNESIKNNLFFKWEVTEITSFEKDIFRPAGKLPQHLHTVECVATFINIDNPEEVVEYITIAGGSDTLDKGVSGASTMAFRNWFDKNFSPSHLTEDIFGEDTETPLDVTEKTTEPTVPTYIPADKKEELTKEVVKETQPEDSESDEVKAIIDNIMKVREITGNAEWGGPTLAKLMNGEIDSVGLMEIELKVNNKLETLGA